MDNHANESSQGHTLTPATTPPMNFRETDKIKIGGGSMLGESTIAGSAQYTTMAPGQKIIAHTPGPNHINLLRLAERALDEGWREEARALIGCALKAIEEETK